MVVTTQSLREQVAWACRILALEGYADLTLGHVSARAPGDRLVYIKRKGLSLDEVSPDDVVELNLDDDAGRDSPEMHLEAVLHTEIYLARPDVQAVVHGHPPYATALSASEAELELLTHDAVLFADGVPFFEETMELITEAEQARAVAAALGERRAVILRNHGVVTVGQSLPWAILAAVTLERAARLQSIAASLGRLRPLSPEWAQRIQPAKYHDRLLEEYWAAWVRRVRRAGADGGMP
jgi:ribulose-5-phosphate 4-epimerase/fuculose-1-phosphate aldolase